ncbi:MAG: hypothetical protein NWE96_02410 [Candidatus Bathyarchaeota archaeon]|nr:hypothetical protein [Candidatus Bathyarchaeota archaeon]
MNPEDLPLISKLYNRTLSSVANMEKMGKYLSLCLVVILAVSSLISIESTYAQSTMTQKPTPPEFTLKFVPSSENITHIDSFTGVKTFEIIDKSKIEVKIKNQLFTKNLNGVNYYLYYNIYVTGHFDPSNQNDWRYEYNFPDNYTKTPRWNKILEATASEYTTVSIGGDYPSHSQIDVHVGAMLMHDGQFRVYEYIGDLTGHLVSGVVQGEISGNVQTFTIPEHLTSSTDSPNPTSIVTTQPTSISPSSPTSVSPSEQVKDMISMPLLTFIVIIAVFLSVIIILLVLILVRTRRQPLHQPAKAYN